MFLVLFNDAISYSEYAASNDCTMLVSLLNASVV